MLKYKNVVLILVLLCFSQSLNAQLLRCDPAKVMTFEACGKCHANEIQVWQQTPHFQTFTELSRRPQAKEICEKLGLRSIKRSNVCIECHYTVAEKNGKNRPVSGISCESCHGAAKDWIEGHADYGGITATRESETASHKTERLANATRNGMRNTRNLYLIATSCYQCHTVPNEKLVNVGGHKAGSLDFELVAWSQGRVRHNFLRGDGVNRRATPERLRVMYIVGLIADLEFSTRATALATSKSTYGMAVAQRAADTSVKLFEAQKKLQHETLQMILEAFATAELKFNNREQLEQIADAIHKYGMAFATQEDGSRLAGVDSMLPAPSAYR